MNVWRARGGKTGERVNNNIVFSFDIVKVGAILFDKEALV